MFRRLPIATALLLAAPLARAAPAAAQDNPGDRVNMVIVYGNDACPRGGGDEIVVCARKDERERFRIPAPFRGENGNSPANTSWAERAQSFERVGASGINSCSPNGSGGASGCLARFIHDAYAERRAATDVQFGKALAEARAKRAATVDTEASAEQARVEELEKQYEAKKRQEAAGEANALHTVNPATAAPAARPAATTVQPSATAAAAPVEPKATPKASAKRHKRRKSHRAG